MTSPVVVYRLYCGLYCGGGTGHYSCSAADVQYALLEYPFTQSPQNLSFSHITMCGSVVAEATASNGWRRLVWAVGSSAEVVGWMIVLFALQQLTAAGDDCMAVAAAAVGYCWRQHVSAGRVVCVQRCVCVQRHMGVMCG